MIAAVLKLCALLLSVQQYQATAVCGCCCIAAAVYSVYDTFINLLVPTRYVRSCSWKVNKFQTALLSLSILYTEVHNRIAATFSQSADQKHSVTPYLCFL